MSKAKLDPGAGVRGAIRGAASHLVLAVVCLSAGAGLAWTVGRRPALDAVTTHGEWVYLRQP